jgi:two-component system, NtrC family, sensor histidine kinase KinB
MDFDEQVSQGTHASLELLYSISRELASALDLRTLLQRILFLSMDYIGAISGSIIVLDDKGQAIDATLIVGKKVYNNTAQQLKVILEGGLAGWVVKHRQAVLIPDTSNDSRWMRRPDDAKNRTGPKSAVSVPLLTREQMAGVMTLVHPTPGFFDTGNLALIQAISDQAGIAVLNARMYAESQRQARAMTAVAESAAAITGALSLEQVIQRILEQVRQALAIQIVSLALIDTVDKTWKYRASTYEGEQTIVGQTLKIPEAAVETVTIQGQGIIFSKPHGESLFSKEIPLETEFEIPALAYAPIRSEGKVIGVLEALKPQEGGFETQDMLFLTGIGNLAGTAIQHAQLFDNLQAAHQRYRDLFEVSIDPILITDWQGHILEANRQATAATGYKKDELLDFTVAQLHDISNDKVGEDFSHLQQGKTVSYESSLRTKSSRFIPIQVYVRDGWIEGISHLQWIFHDITERKELDRLRDDLISMIYHDLRSPLANVVSSLDVLDAILPKGEEATLKPMLNIAMRSTERIQRLTSSLLDINRLEAGQPIVQQQLISPTVLLVDAIETVTPVSENKNQQIIQHLEGDLPAISIDADMIRRVIINLLENAIKFTPLEGTIIVGAKREAEWVHIWIQDTGPGIPAAARERIFDKYTRLQPESGPKGIGLGLAFCRLAVEAHGGCIGLEGKSSEGSRFFIKLPIAPEEG